MNTMTEDLRVMTSGAFTAAYLDLIPRLELLTKKKLVTAATSIGTGENSIPNRLRRGEPVDVVIVADSLLVGFIKDGLIMAQSYTPVARSAIGMAVRAGAPKPDIGTVGEEKGGKRGRESFVDRTARVRIDAMSNATASSFSNRWIGIPRPESTYWSAPII
jgi:ABC-type molybdate transport system substrate-binding protein